MGPCLCGDPYCHSCGSPELAELEAAQDKMLERLAEAKLAADEYELFTEIGLAAVTGARNYAARIAAERAANEAIAKEYQDF